MFALFEKKPEEKALVISLGEMITPNHAKAIQKLMEIKKFDLNAFMEKCNPLFAGFNLGKITEDDLRKQVSEAAGIEELKPEKFREIWNAMIPIDEKSKEKFKTIMEQLKQIQPIEGWMYTVFILSDTNPIHMQYIAENYEVVDGKMRIDLSYNSGKSKLEMLETLSKDYKITYLATPPLSSEKSRKELDEKNREKIKEIVTSYKEMKVISEELIPLMMKQQSVTKLSV